MSFLDNDFYAFTMSYYLWQYHRDVEIKYQLKNRTWGNKLVVGTKRFEQYQDSFDYICEEIPKAQDIEYLKSLNIFSAEYLDALAKVSFRDVLVESGEDKDKPGQITVEYKGPWWKAVFFETPFLAAINEVYHYDHLKYGERHQEKLSDKINSLKIHPYLNFVEFGTRRRGSWTWQDKVIHRMKTHRPWQMVGTSNVEFARSYDLKPIGTMAHQLFMGISALKDHSADHATIEILDRWSKLFQGRLNVALTDTFGTDHFFRVFRQVIHHWPNTGWSFRQDSGDPREIANKYMDHWSHSITPLDARNIVFSDGLDVQKMADLYGQFGNKANLLFGWGTNLTADGLNTPISIVIKPTDIRNNSTGTWRVCCKLSDNVDKACGAPDTIEHYKKLVGYTGKFSERPVY